MKETRLNRGYALCSYARTGSTLLCRALRATGRLGYAQEYFNEQAVDVIVGAEYPTDRSAQLIEVCRRGTSPNGIYGVKMFADQFDALAGFDWIGALPNLEFIHLERRDALGQALSNVRATQTGQWASEQRATRPPRYDEGAILAELSRTAGYRARWQLFFARNGIAPLWLTYEDVVADLAGAVQQVAALVGVTDLPDPLPDLAAMEPQADEITDNWRARFIGAQGNLARLDPLPTARAQTITDRLWQRLRWR